jgi:hypothetical protein
MLLPGNSRVGSYTKDVGVGGMTDAGWIKETPIERQRTPLTSVSVIIFLHRVKLWSISRYLYCQCRNPYFLLPVLRI